MDEKVLVAFDHTRVRISDLEWAWKVNAIYRACLKDEEEVVKAVVGGKK